MAQTFALAPSMRPPMLPVVSRQNTTSTFGLTDFAFSADTAGNSSPASASAANTTRAFMVHSCFRGMLAISAISFDESGAGGDCQLVSPPGLRPLLRANDRLGLAEPHLQLEPVQRVSRPGQKWGLTFLPLP